MASSANSNQVPKLYRSVIEDVINEVRELFLDEGVDEQVLMELKTLWENKLMQSKAVEGFNTDEQAALQAAAQQQAQQAQQATQQAQTQQVLLPPQQQVTSWQSTRPTVTSAPQQQVIVQDPKILQHMSATGMNAATTAATLALPTGISPYQQLITSQGQILQVLRAANGTQYIIQPQQQMVLQQQVLPQMQPGGGQAPVIQQVRPITQVLAPLQGGLPQVLAPLQGGLPQQTGVIIQPQQVILTGNKVQQNAQVMQMTGQPGQVQQIQQQVQQVQQVQGGAAPGGPQQQQQPAMMLQVDGAGDTSSEEEDEEEEYDEEEDEEKEKDGEDGQVEEEPLNSEDDVSDEEDQELFDTENVVVCQYDKIHRSKNKWKFHLKDGIMNLNGRDYVFSKAIGDAEW
ncbi:transcription initiation factor IIA subunit 1 isoform X3 [Salmo salar]|uniref:Transcription initiation factor IIA subunit 1 isoform X3 n=1 Tax=Salmo salar TaxID=8030 RepID=A0A1S3SB23_SALSA|nr:transcription initiation factor IIA subunit 1-like isoform X3 [Salmo salar]|eukprot:XP_014061538.1 PREDICTED: transcription initiation factor IIA subunit 1-like isoform X3 [Salmo salar]